MQTHPRFAKPSFGAWTIRMRMFAKRRPLAWENGKISESFLSCGRCSTNPKLVIESQKLRRASWDSLKSRKTGLLPSTKPRW